MDERSPLDLLILEIREAEVQREAAEEELNQTPGWRFRERARRRALLERRLAEKQRIVAFAAGVKRASIRVSRAEVEREGSAQPVGPSRSASQNVTGL